MGRYLAHHRLHVVVPKRHVAEGVAQRCRFHAETSHDDDGALKEKRTAIEVQFFIASFEARRLLFRLMLCHDPKVVESPFATVRLRTTAGKRFRRRIVRGYSNDTLRAIVHPSGVAYTNRNTDFREKFCVRVDVTEEFPFLVTKLGPYYDR